MPMTDEDFCKLCKSGSYDAIKTALLDGAFVNAVYSSTTPLIIAVYSNPDSRVIDLLCEFGADPGMPNQFGGTPIAIAAEKGRGDVMRILLDFGADINAINDKDRDRAFFNAAESGHLEAVQVFLDSGLELNRELALLKAAENGHVDIVKALLASGIQVSEKVFMITASHGHAKVIKALLDSGADCDRDKLLIESVSSFRPNPELINTLLDSGADARKAIAIARGNRALMGSEVLRRMVRESR